MAPPVEATAPVLPSWRVELNEKVRAIRANRGASTSTAEQPAEEAVKQVESDSRSTIAGMRQDESRSFYDRNLGAHAAASRPESNQPATSFAGTGRRSSNNIVEAALTRVKRASENASRAALPKIEPARSIQPTTQGSLAVDRHATARALDPVTEIEPSVEFKPTPRPEAVHPTVLVPPPVIVPERVESPAIQEPTISAAVEAEPAVQPKPILVLEEIEPLDYLEAEVRKVDKALGAEFKRNESPSIFTHAVIGIVDLIAVVVSCSPFVAIVLIADGSLAITETRLATGAMVAFIAFFYFALTQCLCGRTFGMMLTNTRIVDAQTFEAPSASQALLRTGGYFIGAAPALVGIIWAALNHKHRGWQDFISRTVVVRDF